MLIARQIKLNLSCSLLLHDPGEARNTDSKKRKERKRIQWEKERKLVMSHLLVQVPDYSRPPLGKGRSFDLKQNYFIITHI